MWVGPFQHLEGLNGKKAEEGRICPLPAHLLQLDLGPLLPPDWDSHDRLCWSSGLWTQSGAPSRLSWASSPRAAGAGLSLQKHTSQFCSIHLLLNISPTGLFLWRTLIETLLPSLDLLGERHSAWESQACAECEPRCSLRYFFPPWHCLRKVAGGSEVGGD